MTLTVPDLLAKYREEPAKKTPKNPGILGVFSEYFNEFSNNTTLHGFKYIVDSQRYAIERLSWSVMLFACIYVCGTLILATLRKWETDPVFISFSQFAVGVWNIPFPAITICLSNKIRKTKYNYVNYSRMFKKKILPKDQHKSFADMTKFCGTSEHNFTSHSMDLESMRLFLQNAPREWDVINFCFWNQELCYENFSSVLTDYGLCYTYNSLDKSDLYTNFTYILPDVVKQANVSHWTIDDNYEKTNERVYPLRAVSPADKLFVIMRSPAEDVNLPCGDRSFKIFIHHPAEIPTFSTKYLQLAQHESYDIKITPIVTVTSAQLRSYDPQRRGCYFSKERNLKFFKFYTEQGCKVECFTNHTLQQCGCVSYFMPHDGKTKICGLSDTECESSVENKLLTLDLNAEISGRDEERRSLSCNCLPLCTSIRYNTQITQTEVDDVTVKISFRERTFKLMERNELFSDANFWANCGGLLGLFVGFSILSFAEILYFLTLRWICNLWTLTKSCWIW